MTVTIPTWADLTPVKIREGLAEPVRVKISSGLRRMNEPDFQRYGITVKEGFFRLEGSLALVLEPHLGGTRWWLCGSWMLDQSLPHDWDSHESLLRVDEPAECEIFNLESLKISSRWAVSRIQFIDFRIQHRHMDALRSIMGEPNDGGEVFFKRLLPGRVPAAVRARQNNWQVWLQL
jgi:hypothetical protein